MGSNLLAEGQLSRQACVLLYDGECRLCVSTKAKLEQLRSGRTGIGVRFLAYQSEEARRLLGCNYRPGRPEEAFMIQPSGKVLRGLDAFIPFLPHLFGGKLVLWVLRLTGVRQLAEWGYRMVARHRYRWFGVAKLPG
jgi:predicted DCC family thiol-disulfide oxidoreductase YuxK